ncbi:TIGR03915 family putative DNA repair protein [Dawidia soli]|uniref:TIGR03915 family putative DNA repair protein n=1 Tax=Dawidia soli TaxID=2782352 RepID=A0AAP2DGV0_9BACT|nr:TIGR03915 family putative DNA repair protein [Dawidia soli]MBT1690460.1 TIGR03915 family putative DNA repair protein [Dawidia soli]
MKDLLVYDGSFPGLLTAIFDVYERKLADVSIVREHLYHPDLYATVRTITRDTHKATRVWQGLQKKLATEIIDHFYKSFLSEAHNVEDTLLAFTRYVLGAPPGAERNFAHPAVLEVMQLSKKVHREKHRMEAFVRFQQAADGLYTATIEPDFNVLPLITGHFKDRYADQSWLIYDDKRSYGILYNEKDGQVMEVTAGVTHSATPGEDPDMASIVVHDHEAAYQTLWKTYFQTTSIDVRKNKKLHLRHVPTRYWRYLTEKAMAGP